MSPTLKEYFYILKPQLILLCIVLVLQILSLFSFIPAPSELVTILIDFVSTQGLFFVVVVSFIENFIGLGTYFPGSIAILTAMAATSGDPVRATFVYIAIVIPAAIANILSYWIGYINRDKQSQLFSNRSSKGLLMWYAATYWHPQLAAISALASGGEGIKFWKYFSHFLPISFLWSVFWALLLYNVGHVVSSSGQFIPIFYLYIVIWIWWDIRNYKKNKIITLDRVV